MQRRQKAIVFTVVGVLAVGAIVVVAGPVLYRDFFAQPAAEVPTLSADEQTLLGSSEQAPSLESVDFSGSWVVTEGSFVGYRVDEVLNGSPFTVTGRTEQVNGTLMVDGLTLESAEFTVDVASIGTDNSQRDRYFRDQALKASKHPTASFVLAEPAHVATAPASGEVIDQTLNGALTIAGVTQHVTFTAQLRTDGNQAEIVGQIPITFADFGVQAPNLGFVSVEPVGLVEFSLVAERG